MQGAGDATGAATPRGGWWGPQCNFWCINADLKPTAPRLEARAYSSIPQQRREEVERLLESGGPSGDWRGLAARLGYGDEAIGTFARGQAPARTLLATWAATEGATVEALCLALAAMGRQDVAECLAGPGDASSMV